MSRPRSPLRRAATGGILIVAGAALCISLANVMAPLVYAAGSNAYTLLVLRYCGFLAVCGLWLCWQRAALSLSLADILKCGGAGFAYALGASALLISFKFVSVSLAILMFFTFPLLTRVLESILDRRLPSLQEVGCLIGAFAGLALLLGMHTESLDWLGPSLAVLAAVSVALSFVLTGRTLGHVHPTVMTFYMSVAGLLFALILVTVTGNWQLALAGAAGWFVTTVAVVSFSLAFLAMFIAIRLIGASRMARTMNLEPVFTIFLAFLILDERLSAIQLFGAGLVVLSIVLAQVLEQKQASRPPAKIGTD